MFYHFYQNSVATFYSSTWAKLVASSKSSARRVARHMVWDCGDMAGSGGTPSHLNTCHNGASVDIYIYTHNHIISYIYVYIYICIYMYIYINNIRIYTYLLQILLQLIMGCLKTSIRGFIGQKSSRIAHRPGPCPFPALARVWPTGDHKHHEPTAGGRFSNWASLKQHVVQRMLEPGGMGTIWLSSVSEWSILFNGHDPSVLSPWAECIGTRHEHCQDWWRT